MDIGQLFSDMMSSEQATNVPVVSSFSQATGIGEGEKVLPTNPRGINLAQAEVPPSLPTEEQLAKMDFFDLKGLRDKYSGNRTAQNVIAPYEHRAMNRELVQEGGALDKFLNTASLTIATPTYAIGKATHILPEDISTSTNYVKEVQQGFIGIGEGLKSLFVQEEPKKKMEAISPEILAQIEDKAQFDRIIENLIQTESGGKHTTQSGELVTSSEGAKGITQVLPSTAKKPGYGITPLRNDSPQEYVRFAKDYLGKMIQIFDNKEQAVAAYNAGPGRIHLAIAKAERTGKDWKKFIPKETQQYIEKVLPKEDISTTIDEQKKQPYTFAMGVRD